MKKIIKGIFMPLVVSIIFGFICGKLVYSVYDEDVENKLSSSKLYLIENGEYLTYDNMREENSGNNYVYYNKKGNFTVSLVYLKLKKRMTLKSSSFCKINSKLTS